MLAEREQERERARERERERESTGVAVVTGVCWLLMHGRKLFALEWLGFAEAVKTRSVVRIRDGSCSCCRGDPEPKEGIHFGNYVWKYFFVFFEAAWYGSEWNQIQHRGEGEGRRSFQKYTRYMSSVMQEET
jgi:hypothetical protein